MKQVKQKPFIVPDFNLVVADRQLIENLDRTLSLFNTTLRTYTENLIYLKGSVETSEQLCRDSKTAAIDAKADALLAQTWIDALVKRVATLEAKAAQDDNDSLFKRIFG